jgi:hypothetical protein
MISSLSRSTKDTFVFRWKACKSEKLLKTNKQRVYIIINDNGLVFKNNENICPVTEGLCKILLQ